MFKMLSLDGGGSWAILQLLTLKEKYGNQTGHEILREFDLVIANSGGSIVLAALAENWSIDKALDLFKTEANRKLIFNSNSFFDRFFPFDFIKKYGPKYSSAKKGRAFKALFRQVDKYQLHELPNYIGKPSLKLIVCTYDALNNKAKFFKSYHLNKDMPYDSVRLTQAIHGSSNAPLAYFDFPARFKAKESELFYELWDGALGGFNNPLVAGLLEVADIGIPLKDVQIVSIGTGNKTMSQKEKERFYQLKQITIRERRIKWKFWRWKYQFLFFQKVLLNQAKTILFQPPDWANYVSLKLLSIGGIENAAARIVRLSPMLHSDSNTHPAVLALLDKLYNLDMDLTSDGDMELILRCFDEWKQGKIRNQPLEYHITRANELIHVKGDEHFQEAMRHWNSFDLSN